MKLIYSFLFISFFMFTGCQETLLVPKKNNQNTLAHLNNVHYEVKDNGEVLLHKEYSSYDKDTNTTKKTIIKEKISKTHEYERVPNFTRSYKKQISIKNKKKSFSVKGGKVKVSVESIPLNEFINLVFGSILKLNYTLKDDVKKIKDPITLNMTEEQKSSEFFQVVKKILSLHGIGVKEENNLFFIYKIANKSSSVIDDIYIGYGRSLPRNLDDDKEVFMFVPYNYISSNSARSILRNIGIKVRMFTFMKGIETFRGKAIDVRNALKTINLIDRPYMEGKIPYIVYLKNVNVKAFQEHMKKIFTLNSINVTTTPSKGGIAMLPIEELNALYVIASKKEWINMLLYWKKKLDIESKTVEAPRLYIYHVKNRKADELANAVKAVLGLSSVKNTTNIIKNNNTAGEEKKKKTTIAKQVTTSSDFLISRVNYTPTVTADLDSNILMMKLTPKHHKLLIPFIEELDKLPLQTLVEVTVAEVDMTDTFSLGFEYAIRNKGLGIEDILNISGGGSGLGVVFNSSKLDATVNAFAEKQLLDIVSKPKILILNNTTGTINVGTQVPIITSETSAADINTGTTPSINRNITYRNTGINLGLTPTINSNGVLTMKISISLSEAQLNDTSGIDSPLIVDRKLNTVAVIHSGDTILIGGLISENKSKSKGGIPYLKDIPYFGEMFANQSHKNTKTELIMLIRPIIIETPKAIHKETDRFKTILNYINLDEL